MELIQHSIEVPKETKEAIDLVAALIGHFKEGKSLAELTGLLDEFMTAVNGAADIDDEVKSEHKEAILAYLVHQVGGIFI